MHFDLTGARPANGRRSGFGQATPNSLTYIVNGVRRVFHFTCVKSILLEVDDFLVRRISFSLASIFWKKKKKERTLQGKGRDFEFFCRILLTRSSRKPSVKSSLSSDSSLQKVLDYRRKRQSIQSGSTAFASKHDELSADKKSRAIRAGLP